MFFALVGVLIKYNEFHFLAVLLHVPSAFTQTAHVTTCSYKILQCGMNFQRPKKRRSRSGGVYDFSNFEVCAILGYYVAYNGNSVPKFRNSLSVTPTTNKSVKKNLKHVLYTDWLRIARFGDGIRMRAKFSAVFQTSPGAHPAFFTMGRVSFPGVKSPGRGVDHQPQLAPKLNKELSYTSTPPVCLHVLT